MAASEKRRAQRFAMALPATVKAEEAGVAEASVKTIDISSSGVYFEFTAPIEIGSSLEFVLTLPGEITQGKSIRVRCKGKVVRVDRPSPDKEKIGVAATIERYSFVREP